MTLNYIIADDDIIYRELMLQHLNTMPELVCLAVCDNALEVRKKLQDQPADLLILDVEMPGLSGIDLVESLSVQPMIIFISSHSSYAIDAFNVDAIDFLIKPSPLSRIMRAVNKALHLHELKKNTHPDEGFKPVGDDAFFIKDKGSFLKIVYNQVMYIESLGDFVDIHLEDGSKKIALVNMKSLEQQLPASLFLRISRNFMINKTKLTAVDSNNVVLGKIQLPVGKTYTNSVLQAILGNNIIKRHI